MIIFGFIEPSDFSEAGYSSPPLAFTYVEITEDESECTIDVVTLGLSRFDKKDH